MSCMDICRLKRMASIMRPGARASAIGAECIGGNVGEDGGAEGGGGVLFGLDGGGPDEVVSFDGPEIGACSPSPPRLRERL